MANTLPQPPAAETPHPSVWTVNLIVLSAVVFSLAFGVGTQVIHAERRRQAEEAAIRRNALEARGRH